MSRTDKPVTKRYMASVAALYGNTQPLPKKKLRVHPEVTPEWKEQAALVKWARLKLLPLFAIPNGGKRSLWQGQKERAMGLTAGVCDLFLAIPANGYGGMFLEMKSRVGKLSPLQTAFIHSIRKYGYRADVYNSWEAAKIAIEEYLHGTQYAVN